MTKNARILVIDQNIERLHDIQVLLNFLHEPCELSDMSSWKKTLTSMSDQAEIIIAWQSDYPSMDLLSQSDLPVILLSDSEIEPIEHHQIVNTLTYPMYHNQLVAALHHAEVYLRQHLANRSKDKKTAALFKTLVGASKDMQMVRDMMRQVVDKDVTVLVTGESGTGKEVVARNLHDHSKRKLKPFVPINCGAIPAELIESELFGHEKGAFTGAITSRAGRFEMAEGGTLFLDEIGDLPLPMQVKLLRVLQERTFERVGGTKTLNADVRIITATHRDLDKMIENGEFREDLYYRINVFPIEMPSLRERTDDVLLLLQELIARLENENRGTLKLDSTAIQSLTYHEWPGNIREMSNLVERLSIMFPQEVVGFNELPKKYRHPQAFDAERLEQLESELPIQTDIELAESNALINDKTEQPIGLLPLNGLDLKEYLTNLEKSLIQQALDDANGVVARAAEKLHIRRTTLVEKMKKLDITK